jgi:hypothetical protein
MQRHHRRLQVLLREFTLFLRSSCASRRADLCASMGARRRGADAPVVVLGVHRLR